MLRELFKKYFCTHFCIFVLIHLEQMKPFFWVYIIWDACWEFHKGSSDKNTVISDLQILCSEALKALCFKLFFHLISNIVLCVPIFICSSSAPLLPPPPPVVFLVLLFSLTQLRINQIPKHLSPSWIIAESLFSFGRTRWQADFF